MSFGRKKKLALTMTATIPSIRNSLQHSTAQHDAAVALSMVQEVNCTAAPLNKSAGKRYWIEPGRDVFMCIFVDYCWCKVNCHWLL